MQGVLAVRDPVWTGEILFQGRPCFWGLYIWLPKISPASARVPAACALLDRGWGRPPQHVDVDVDPPGGDGDTQTHQPTVPTPAQAARHRPHRPTITPGPPPRKPTATRTPSRNIVGLLIPTCTAMSPS